MYADDLALVADNALSLQTMINTVYEYSCDWRYKINPSKSSILVIGESVVSRAKNRELRHWSLGNLKINEAEEAHHLGILKSASPSSTMPRTNQRASRGRSAFFALNAVGARFGNLHPHTILKLYRTLCLPTLLFGSELWMLNKNRAHNA